MIQKFLAVSNAKHARWKVGLIKPYIGGAESILDFGCGDMNLAREIQKRFPRCRITGVDVIDSSRKAKTVPFVLYDGKVLPFTDNSFDTVISFYVYHHCDDPVAAFRQCLRVARKRVIIVESVYRSVWDVPGMRFMDWIYNVIKQENVSLPYTFLSVQEWEKVISDSRATVLTKRRVDQLFLPSWILVGTTYVFDVSKTKKI